MSKKIYYLVESNYGEIIKIKPFEENQRSMFSLYTEFKIKVEKHLKPFESWSEDFYENRFYKNKGYEIAIKEQL